VGVAKGGTRSLTIADISNPPLPNHFRSRSIAESVEIRVFFLPRTIADSGRTAATPQLLPCRAAWWPYFRFRSG